MHNLEKDMDRNVLIKKKIDLTILFLTFAHKNMNYETFRDIKKL